MRVIHGEYSGRRLQIPKNIKARPTTDFAREGLFNILNNRVDIEDLKVLDLFAGTGSISYEFASLGCRNLTCIENNALHVRTIVKNAEELGIDFLNCIKTDAFKFLERPKGSYDLIFADPPYDHPKAGELPDLLINNGFLKAEGLLIVEHGPSRQFNSHSAWKETRKYGKVHFSFFSI